MRLGYNTNGLAHHDLLQAIELLADIGYHSVAITIDHAALNPYSENGAQQIEQVRQQLRRFDMESVVETGARFLLDPYCKHEPTLMTADPELRARRVDFLCRAIDVAAELSSQCMSCWSGILREDLAAQAALERLAGGLQKVVEYAASRRIPIGFEPEPGMFIATMQDFERLLQRFDSPYLGLTLDVGHLHCQDEIPIAEVIHRWSDRLLNVHIEDMRRGRHEHLMFGEGEMEFPPILEALGQCGYQGGVHVELSRHSHEGPTAARKAWDYLAPLMPKA